MSQVFLGYMESIPMDEKIEEKDVIAWYVEGVEHLLESEEQVDEQAKMASVTVQWMIDKNHVYRTEDGLELAALFSQKNLCFDWKRQREEAAPLGSEP